MAKQQEGLIKLEQIKAVDDTVRIQKDFGLWQFFFLNLGNKYFVNLRHVARFKILFIFSFLSLNRSFTYRSFPMQMVFRLGLFLLITTAAYNLLGMRSHIR